MPRGLKKGQTNNPNGRPKGVPNKLTGDLRTFYANLIDENRAEIIKRLKRLDDVSFFAAIDRINRYVLPTLASVTSEVTVTNKLEQLSTEQLEKLINSILQENE